MTEPLLVVDDIRKEYARGRRSTSPAIVAVDGVSLALGAAGSTAVVGESGSGKTTLARIIVGLERQTSGLIKFEGRPRSDTTKRAGRLAVAKQVQMVFQDPYSSLDPRQTGRQCLDESLRVHTELSRPERAQRIDELATQVGLGADQMALLPHRLSGGQRQRLAIARALAVQPQILVLDEAVSALDVSVQAQVLNLLIKIRRETGIAFLFISHDLAVVRQVSDEVVVMRHGVVVETGPTAGVLDGPQHPYTKLLRDSVPRSGWRPKRTQTASVAE